MYEKYITLLENDPRVIVGELGIRDTVNMYGLGPFTQYLGVIELHPLDDYKLWCRLMTGEIKIYDFSPHLTKPMFKHLKDPEKFKDVTVIDGTPTWISAKSGKRDLDLGISWIINHGVDVNEV